jgi:hypothetical protein
MSLLQLQSFDAIKYDETLAEGDVVFENQPYILLSNIDMLNGNEGHNDE